MTDMQGLSTAEVQARRASGQGNDARINTSRTYLEILRHNAFTFINSTLFAIGAVLILLGRTGDAVVTAGLVLMNVLVGVVQEGRAKRTLDRIALLTRPRATVIRDGQEQTVDPADIVVGDLLVARPGDQIVVDGAIAGDGRIDVDESQLTGESDLIPKQQGDTVYSGSFCVTGAAVYEAQKVGADSFAHKITAGARLFRVVKTPLQRDVDYVIRVLVVLAAQLGVLLALSFALQEVPLVEQVQVAAVIAALVPQGLFFMTTVTYAMGAVRMATSGVLVQQANAIESMSNVNMLCMDKTGTLTTNRIRFEAAYPVNLEQQNLEHLLGDFVASSTSGNKTSEAIRQVCEGQKRSITDEVPFSSARKWSGLVFDDPAAEGTYVLGAPEILWPYLTHTEDLEQRVASQTSLGKRVLLFARGTNANTLHEKQERPTLPEALTPLGILSFSDELRPEVQQTIQGFREAGIRLKVISGDNPETVSALARQAGLGSEARAISGLQLAEMDADQFAQAARETTIFGRITPEQKEHLVGLLRSSGYYVAMIGDGVNDVLSLKKAQIGIAMNSGSQATRSVADIILLNDSFGVLPKTFQEGQRILNGMQDIVRLFLARTFYVTFLVLATAIVGLAFPVTPKHNSILALLTVGIPTIALAAWARAGQPVRGLLRAVSHFVFPASFSVGIVSLGIYLYYTQTADLATAQTALTTTMTLCGILLIIFVEPPTAAWVGGDVLSGDRRPALLALLMLLAFGAIMLVEPLRTFFELTLLPASDYLLIGLIVGLWAVILRFVWRQQLLDRLLSPTSPATPPD